MSPIRWTEDDYDPPAWTHALGLILLVLGAAFVMYAALVPETLTRALEVLPR